jgi:glycosyltransferase involved in cell wall biosynthesis
VRVKLAIISTHPIQYYAPWFTYLSNKTNLDVRVFYLWDFGVSKHLDKGFDVSIRWDIPLLEGYDHEFIVNKSYSAGTGHFLGLWNPDLPHRVRQFAPDAILLTAYNYASIGYLLWCWRKERTPLLFRGDSHRLVSRRGLLESVKREVIARVFRCFSAVLYVGSANREYFVIHRVSNERLFFSPHAVDNERFVAARVSAEVEAASWKRSLGIPDNHRVILFAGKFEEKKRPLDLLRAFLSASFENTSLLYVGSGALEQSLRTLSAGHPHVHFAPFQNQSLMPRTYAACDVLVLPSYGPAETWGLAVNEAMCMGRAVIVSDHVGCAQDLVIPNENGLVYPAGDIDALADCLRDALSDIRRLQAWGERGRELIKGYSYKQATEGLINALASLGITGFSI